MNVLVTGGAGFIGSRLCERLVEQGHFVVNLDALAYAGNLDSLRGIEGAPNYRFVHGNILDEKLVLSLLREHGIESVIHLAAESHVDRSIDAPDAFAQTNVIGTVHLLKAALAYFEGLDGASRDGFRFVHVSTDEVHGDLPFEGDEKFNEESAYDPSSPYSASKAASDHFARAWMKTYGLPVLVTNCSNNYGPFQFPEKLIPMMILNAVEDLPLPIYAEGRNVRDWLFVEDHVLALEAVAERGEPGENFHVGADAQRSNLETAKAICSILDRESPRSDGKLHSERIAFVEDRPGHDRRYAMDATRIRERLGWRPRESFESGLEKTVRWYLGNEWWWRPLREKGAGRRRGRR